MEEHLKEQLIKEMTEILKTPSFKSLTEEELSIILYQDVIGPWVGEMEKHFAKLAYQLGPFRSESH